PNTSRSDGTANQAVKQRCCTSNLKPPYYEPFKDYGRNQHMTGKKGHLCLRHQSINHGKQQHYE
ncbi:hypothetical protein, partial [Acidithiobacillus thiooxidans]